MRYSGKLYDLPRPSHNIIEQSAPQAFA